MSRLVTRPHHDHRLEGEGVPLEPVLLARARETKNAAREEGQRPGPVAMTMMVGVGAGCELRLATSGVV